MARSRHAESDRRARRALPAQPPRLVGARAGAGLFVYFAMPFLAAAQIFVYVGGVLVLMIFAIMLVHRGDEGRPEIISRHDIGSLFVAGGLFAMVMFAFWDIRDSAEIVAEPAGVDALSDAMLGPLFPHFQAAGVLLLTALVAILVIRGGDSE